MTELKGDDLKKMVTKNGNPKQSAILHLSRNWMALSHPSQVEMDTYNNMKMLRWNCWDRGR